MSRHWYLITFFTAKYSCKGKLRSFFFIIVQHVRCKIYLPSCESQKIGKVMHLWRCHVFILILLSTKYNIPLSMLVIDQVYSLTILMIWSHILSFGFTSASPSKSVSSRRVSSARASPAFLSQSLHSSPSSAGTLWSLLRALLTWQRFFCVFSATFTPYSLQAVIDVRTEQAAPKTLFKVVHKKRNIGSGLMQFDSFIFNLRLGCAALF